MPLQIPYECLRPIERLIIILKDILDLSNEEIAQALSEPASRVAERLGVPVAEIDNIPEAAHMTPNRVAVLYNRSQWKLVLLMYKQGQLYVEGPLTGQEFKVAWDRRVNNRPRSVIARAMELTETEVEVIERNAMRKLSQAVSDTL